MRRDDAVNGLLVHVLLLDPVPTGYDALRFVGGGAVGIAHERIDADRSRRLNALTAQSEEQDAQYSKARNGDR